MKKSLILGILTLAASVAPSFGQGVIWLDNYTTGGPTITYGDTTSGGSIGAGLLSGWTVGVYYAQGNVTGSVAADGSFIADPSTLGGGLALGTGGGSTANVDAANSFFTPGQFYATGAFNASSAGGNTITLEIVAYNGADYLSSTARGHSSAFTLVTSANTSSTTVAVGSAMPAFSVFAVPEPTTFALAGLGAAALMIFRRKKQ